MKLACVKILLLGHQGFIDRFLLLVILHNAWRKLVIGINFLSLSIFFFSFFREQFNLEKIFVPYYLSGLVVVSFYVPRERSDVLSLD